MLPGSIEQAPSQMRGSTSDGSSLSMSLCLRAPRERQFGAQAPMLMVFSFLIVFLVPAALYESWTVPLGCWRQASASTDACQPN
jgi:multidrug efflux pump subunit AcrB